MCWTICETLLFRSDFFCHLSITSSSHEKKDQALPTCPYCKQWKAWWGLGMRLPFPAYVSKLAKEIKSSHTGISIYFLHLPSLRWLPRTTLVIQFELQHPLPARLQCSKPSTEQGETCLMPRPCRSSPVRPQSRDGRSISASWDTLTRGVVCGVCPSQYNPGMARVSLDTRILWLFAMPKDGQGSFSSKSCHDNYWYYVHPKNGMASLDMSDRDEAPNIALIV